MHRRHDDQEESAEGVKADIARTRATAGQIFGEIVPLALRWVPSENQTGAASEAHRADKARSVPRGVGRQLEPKNRISAPFGR
jgi:hypothetical protein